MGFSLGEFFCGGLRTTWWVLRNKFRNLFGCPILIVDFPVEKITHELFSIALETAFMFLF